jgi:hypothetical protein
MGRIKSMNRVHLFEFEDQNWIPEMFRNMITQITQYTIDFFLIYDNIIPKIEELLQTTTDPQIIDLCSGSSGPWLKLVKQIQTPIKVLLTDKYPNFNKWKEVVKNSQGKFDYSKLPIDARTVPSELKGLRTIFTGFHHFKPEEAKLILERAISQNQPIAVFEFTRRSLTGILLGSWLTLLVPFFETPFIKPRTLSRFLWTYLIPVVPVLHFWDGLVSNLRTYSIAELQSLVNSIDGKGYTWEIGAQPVKSRGMTGEITYLTGYPAKHRSG